MVLTGVGRSVQSQNIMAAIGDICYDSFGIMVIFELEVGHKCTWSGQQNKENTEHTHL